MIKWRIELVVTEIDVIFKCRFRAIREFEGNEIYANYMLDGYLEHFESKGYTVGGGLEKVDE